MVVSALLVANVVLTVVRPDLKRAVVAAVQRAVVNPIVGALFRIGVVPFGYALLETTGRKSGLPRRIPVGNGLCGNTFWIVAEHGIDAGYVRNLIADPHVRVKLRRGLRFVWVDGVATMTSDDPLRRQRELCGWHPLRWLNAITVRTLGTDLVAVRVDLQTLRPR
ncbi:nitroreductase family deazaflavin-dependent oxidoreductase [Antrihabitans cavernicola]|uniref:Nitroreductase family deazaflavin-dependent oxidoreductase n=2 Tax=Antrihabitans cavernicola TaxID=2495913 RepID=A0A5A7SJU3_9NOCA|nr:nitroreductase family deazaflavin-dependent oxidoreductase [Spelaeibacter cavernicola]